MLGSPTVEAACLPRPRYKPLPSSPRSSPLPGTYIIQGFPSGDPKLPTSSPPSRTCLQALVTVPASLPGQRASQGKLREKEKVTGVEEC